MRKKDEKAIRNIVDPYIREKDRIVLTEKELGLTCLRSIGHATLKNVFLPLEMHIHKNCIEIVTVIKGRQTYIAGGISFTLTGGDVFISFADQSHGSGENLQEINEIIWMQIDTRFKSGFLGLDTSLGRTLHNKLLSIREPVFRADRSSIKILLQAFEHLSKMTAAGIQTGQSLLVTYLNHLAQTQLKRDEMESCFSDALKFIENNLCDQIEISDLCEICSLSESRLKHKFAEIVGVPPRQYINTQRIIKAEKMLKSQSEDQKQRITDIAMACGFSSANYFSTVFRKYTGRSPTGSQ